MNPLEFPWKEDQQVTVINPTAETFKFKVHAKDYEVGAGKQAKMPGFIAWVYVYNMAVQLVQQDGFFNRWNEEEFRQEYYAKAYSGFDPVVDEIATIEEPSLVQTIDDEPIEEPVDAPVTPDPEPEEPAKPPIDAPQVAPMKAKAKAKA